MKKITRFFCLILIFCIAFSLAAAPAEAASACAFTDVPSNLWYYSDVLTAWQNGLILGMSDTKFAPDDEISIAQTVTLAARLNQRYYEGSVTLENGFPWYSTFVDYAVREGIIEDGAYDGRWDDKATREEFVEIFYRAMPESEYGVQNTVDDNAIPDVRVSDPCGPEVYAFYRAGILIGSDGNRFCPDTNISRCQVAAIMTRMYTPSQRKPITLTLSVPLIDAPQTAENVQALLNAYDPDGAFIMRWSMENDGFFMYWLSDGTLITENLNTAVHEECHGFSAAWDKVNIYLGGGKSIVVPYTKVFYSNLMVDSIPNELRTFRFDVYVDGDEIVGSVQNGAYGLLNEFNAYYWGTNNSVRLFEYYQTQPQTTENKMAYVQEVAGTTAAYAEFRFYILHYLLYARDNYPDVYSGIMGNEQFKLAFRNVDQGFAAVIDRFYETLDIMGVDIVSGEYGRINYGTLVGLNITDYNTLMTEMKKPEYRNLLALLYA